MTRKQARLLVLVLTTKGIPFKYARRNGAYVVFFPKDAAAEVAMAVGA